MGPGNHQLLYSNVNGKKAPFTASRAEDRQDLLKLEAELKRQGMDVDVQRYYLIQVPIKHDAQGVQLSNMGRPPEPRYHAYPMGGMPESDGIMSGSYNGAVMAAPPSSGFMPKNAMKSAMPEQQEKKEGSNLRRSQEGLVKVAIGHGETEGKYFGGTGFAGKRSDEPVRVTVVYFVTPIAEVSEADMQNFANAFQAWDSQAIWGGSFVTTASK